MKAIEITDLVKVYGDVIAVNGLDLSVTKGSICGFLGENGAGKSTTLKILMGLAYPTQGSVEILGMNIKEHRLDIARRTGAVIETPGFIPYLTGKQILRQLSSLQGYIDKDEIDEILAIVGLSDAADKKTGTYSTGMKQRLGLGQALLDDPELLLLDEPFSGMDIQGTFEVKSLLSDLNKRQGLTILLSSHRLRDIDRLCSDVVIIKDGSALISGKVSDLLQARSTVTIEVSDAQLTSQILSSNSVPHVATDGNWLRLTMDGMTRNELVDILNEASVSIYYLSENEMSLEDLYLNQTIEVST